MFGSNFKWAKKQPPNFLYLICCEIELFFKKICGKKSLKISIVLLTKDSFLFDSIFLMLPNSRKHKKLFLHNIFHQNKH